MIPGRRLTIDCHRAAVNMAIDESISLAVAAKDQPATLRFYQWQRPTLSLGYFQSRADATSYIEGFNSAGLKRADGIDVADGIDGIDVVRRSTGGGAIVHQHDLTYSLSLPIDDAGPGPREHVYLTMHRSIQESLRELGILTNPYRNFPLKDSNDSTRDAVTLRSRDSEPFLCFQRRSDEDLICGGYKILGSAQRRVRGGLLQHGSLLLRTSPIADSLPGIAELTNVTFPLDSFADAIANRIGHELDIDWTIDTISHAERERAEEIRTTRYAADEWLRRR